MARPFQEFTKEEYIIIDNLKRLIAESGRPKTQVARSIGITPQMLLRFLRGASHIKHEYLVKISELLKVDIKEITGE